MQHEQPLTNSAISHMASMHSPLPSISQNLFPFSQPTTRTYSNSYYPVPYNPQLYYSELYQPGTDSPFPYDEISRYHVNRSINRATIAPRWASLATERQTADQIDFFFVDNQGRVNVMWVVGTGNWSGPVAL